MTALTLYLAGVASNRQGDANQLFNGAAGAPSTSQPTTFVGTSLGFGETWAVGTSNPWPGASQLAFLPYSGRGWLFDASLLNGQDLQAGAYSATLRYVAMQGVAQGGTLGADLYLRIAKFTLAELSYTPIATLSLLGQSLTSVLANYTLSGSASSATSFYPGDFLYIDNPLNITANTNGQANQGYRINRLSLDTTNFTGDPLASITTPGYLPTSTPVTSSIYFPSFDFTRRRFNYAN